MLMIMKFFIGTLLYMFGMFVMFTLSSREQGFLRRLHCFYILITMIVSVYVVYMAYTPMVFLYIANLIGSLVLWLACSKENEWHFTAISGLEIVSMSIFMFTMYLCIVILKGNGDMVWELFN